MNRRKRKILAAIVIGLIGVTGVVSICFAPPPTHNLLERATKVADVRKGGSFTWLTSDDLLLQTTIDPAQNIGQTVWSGYFELINARTGRRTRLEGLSKAIMEHACRYDPSSGPIGFTQSPDGQWLLSENLIVNGHLTPITIHRDGSGYQEWKPDEDHYWIEGHRWVSFFYRPQRNSEDYTPERLILHDAAQPDAARNLAPASPEWQAISARDFDPSSEDLERILFANPVPAKPSETKPSDVAFKIYRSPSNDPQTRHPPLIATVTFPPETRILDNHPNPQNTQIAFLVSEPGIPAYGPILRRFLPHYRYQEHPVECLCIFRADTRKLVEIGRKDLTSEFDSAITHVFWLPDGKHIQFLYKDAVYRVPTD